MIHYFSGSYSNFSNFKTDTSIEWVIEYLSSKTILGVDTETEGFFDFEKKMVMFQIGDKENQFVFDTRTYDITPLLPILSNDAIIKIFWNFSFDHKFIKYWYKTDTSNVYDGFLAECCLTNGVEGRILSLGGVCERDLGIVLNKEVRNTFLGLMGRPFSDSQITYGAKDVIHLIDLYYIQQKKIIELDLEPVVRLENKFVSVLADVELTGIYLDKEKWIENAERNEQRQLEYRYKLDKFVLDNNLTAFIDFQLDMFSNDVSCGVNWDSPKQVVAVLNQLGVNTTVVDKGVSKETCVATHISKYKKEVPFIGIYLKYKEVKKSVSTYGMSFLDNINPVTGRVHSNFWQILNTGRISSSDPNLQNIPATKEFRSCFTATEGNTLIVCDYSQQEPRVTADKSQDPALIDFYLHGHGDTHTFVTSKMMSVMEGKTIDIPPKNEEDPEALAAHKNHPYAKYRQQGKILNLKLDYGGSAYTVKDDLGVKDEAEAQVFIDALQNAFPEKKRYFQRKIKETFDKGYVLIDEITKRKCFLADIPKYEAICKEKKDNPDFNDWSSYYKLKGNIERASKNFPIQGTSGSMTKLAAIYFVEGIKKLNLQDRARIVNLVHDEIVVEGSLESRHVVAKVLSKSMEKAGAVFCKTVPMIAKAYITLYWEH